MRNTTANVTGNANGAATVSNASNCFDVYMFY